LNIELEPKVIINEANFIGEGILWHSDHECLYWTDIPNSKIFKYTPSTRLTLAWDTESSVGGFTIHEDGRLLLFMDEGAIKLWMDGNSETVIESIKGMEGNRFNDVIADPNGRVFCGVMSTSKRKGWVYRLDPDKSLRKVIYNTGTANGMGFSKNEEKLFFSDSKKSNVSIFDYEKETGKISNRKIIFQTLRSKYGSPDGLCLDTNDNLWIGLWDGAGIIQIDQKGALMQKIKFPTKKITTLCFGGTDLNDIYINSAGADNIDLNGKLAGALFNINIGVRGKNEYRSRLEL